MAKSPEAGDRPGELFFQLANADRRRILEEAVKEDLKLSETARKLNLTPTETFRHLQRLTEGGLLARLPDGRYGVTAYARLVLDSSSSLDFASQHREFFTDHDASRLPPEFRNRLGELSKGVLSTENFATLNKITEGLRNAKLRIDIIVYAHLGVVGEIMQQRQQEGVKLRMLLPESFIPEQEALPPSSRFPIEMRVLPVVCASMVMTEKEAGVSLPRIDGKFDLVGFYGNDESFLRWTGDLFRNQWEKAKPWHPSLSRLG